MGYFPQYLCMLLDRKTSHSYLLGFLKYLLKLSGKSYVSQCHPDKLLLLKDLIIT